MTIINKAFWGYVGAALALFITGSVLAADSAWLPKPGAKRHPVQITAADSETEGYLRIEQESDDLLEILHCQPDHTCLPVVPHPLNKKTFTKNLMIPQSGKLDSHPYIKASLVFAVGLLGAYTWGATYQAVLDEKLMYLPFMLIGVPIAGGALAVAAPFVAGAAGAGYFTWYILTDPFGMMASIVKRGREFATWTGQTLRMLPHDIYEVGRYLIQERPPFAITTSLAFMASTAIMYRYMYSPSVRRINFNKDQAQEIQSNVNLEDIIMLVKQVANAQKSDAHPSLNTAEADLGTKNSAS